MKKKIVSTVLACLVLAVSANAEDVIEQKDVDEINKMAKPVPIEDAGDRIEDWGYEVIHKFGVDEFGENNEKYFFFASQSVSLKPTDPQYGDALVNAYDKAMMDLQNQYLMARFGKNIVDKVKSFYSDRSTHAKEIELPQPGTTGFLGKVMRVFDKSLDVTDKKLDEELIKLGVSPEELEKMTPTMKKDVFRDKFVKNSIRKASGSIAGLFPIQTAIVKDKSGRVMVGVVAVATPKTIQIAKDIRLQRKPLVKGRGRDVSELLPQSKEEYLSTFGVRLAYDKDGTPMIISYGIGSYSKDGDDNYINDQLKKEASANAVSNADAQISEIVNGYMSSRESRKNGEEIRKYVERKVKPDSDTIEKTIKNIIKITNNTAKSSAKMSLKGVSTAKKWRYTTPEGVKFVGAVRVWKYSTLQAANNFNNAKYGQKHKKRKKHSYSEGMEVSKPVNDINDF